MRSLNRPVSWWGWHGWHSQPIPMSITEIVEAGSMPPRLAALFWVALERGASLIIAADPPLSGKTTILTALLSFTPPAATAYFTQGLGETFALPPRSDSQPVYILINEISDHLPVYTWGPYAVRAFELLAQGYSLGSTMHADSVEEVLALLEEQGIPRRHLACLTFIVTLRLLHRRGQILRRVDEVAYLEPDGDDGLAVHRVAHWDEESDSFRLLESPQQVTALARRLGLSEETFRQELDRRQSYLTTLIRLGIADPRQVEEAIASYPARTGTA